MSSFTFQSQVVDVRNPIFGDTDSYDYGLIVKRAIDGTAYTYLNTPVLERFSINFTRLNRPKILELIELFKDAAGQELYYTDYNDITWRGKILNLSEFIHQSIRNNTFSLEFEGVKVL